MKWGSAGGGSAPVVLKLGGSLLALPNLRARLADLLAEFAAAPCVLVVGGGAAADVVREWSARAPLSEEAAHALALRALALTEALVVELLPCTALATSRDEVGALLAAGRVPVLSLAPVVFAAEQSDECHLPHTWDVTTDSLAAWAVGWLRAERLVLVKSCPRPMGTVEQAARDGQVDAWFPRASAGVGRIDWIHLSAGAAGPIECARWRGAGEEPVAL